MQTQRERARLRAAERDSARQSYATTGGGPVRQSLYDRAVTAPPNRDLRDSNSSDDSDQDLEAIGATASNNVTNARSALRSLERALQNYRSTRNSLRFVRPVAPTELGAVPTASALRAYWANDPPADNDSARRPHIPAALSFEYRQERQRARAEYVRIRTERERGIVETESRLTTRKERKTSEAFIRVRNSIRYLSQLRHTGVEGGLELARQLDLDSLYESEEANTPSDLPMHINSLPMPQYSSWLEPGMVWHGLQSTEREPIRSSTIGPSSARRERLQVRLPQNFAHIGGLGLDITNEDFDLMSLGPLVNSDRFLSDLLQSDATQWGPSQPSHPTQSSPHLSESDHWPVNVTLHSVDFDSMTLTGTMSASHMPERLSSVQRGASESRTSSTSMSSFFTGEIIDFRQQPLETEAEGRNYRVGGLDVDARYWARLGPFREEIERVKNLRGKRRSEYQQDSSLWDALRKAVAGENKDSQTSPGILTPPVERSTLAPGRSEDNPSENGQSRFGGASAESEESKEAEDDEIMARSLGSAKWIEAKLGREWILMRWKERYFVTPSSTEASSSSNSDLNPTRTILTAASSSATPTYHFGASNGHGSTSWGLTISGFYYIALNRMTGQIDGLYYDPGSQPYQALKMVPEGTPFSKWGEKSCICGCGDRSCSDAVGLKKWFPSAELR